MNLDIVMGWSARLSLVVSALTGDAPWRTRRALLRAAFTARTFRDGMLMCGMDERSQRRAVEAARRG